MIGKRNTLESIWSYVTNFGNLDTCWEWQRYVDKDGYGHITINCKDNLVHRIAYNLVRGNIPNGMCVCHSCDNPKCCNPNHLWLGTNIDNIEDRVRKGRSARGQRHGSKTHPERIPRGARSGRYTHPEATSRGIKHSKVMSRVAAKGEKNGNSKLSTEQVAQIKLLRVRGLSQTVIARMCNTSQTNVSSILAGKTRVVC